MPYLLLQHRGKKETLLIEYNELQKKAQHDHDMRGKEC